MITAKKHNSIRTDWISGLNNSKEKVLFTCEINVFSFFVKNRTYISAVKNVYTVLPYQ